MGDLTGVLLLGVEFREAVVRTGGVHGNPKRSIAALDILGDMIGSVNEAGTGRARKVWESDVLLLVTADSAFDEPPD